MLNHSFSSISVIRFHMGGVPGGAEEEERMTAAVEGLQGRKNKRVIKNPPSKGKVSEDSGLTLSYAVDSR